MTIFDDQSLTTQLKPSHSTVNLIVTEVWLDIVMHTHEGSTNPQVKLPVTITACVYDIPICGHIDTVTHGVMKKPLQRIARNRL